jgi:hypothetical protein
MIAPDTAAAAGIRPSARVRTIATLMEEDESEIRRMVARGELEAHRKGKRGIRIYLDSVADFQRRRELVPIRSHSAHCPNTRASRPVNRAAYRAAMASLRKDGIV